MWTPDAKELCHFKPRSCSRAFAVLLCTFVILNLSNHVNGQGLSSPTQGGRRSSTKSSSPKSSPSLLHRSREPQQGTSSVSSPHINLAAAEEEEDYPLAETIKPILMEYLTSIYEAVEVRDISEMFELYKGDTDYNYVFAGILNGQVSCLYVSKKYGRQTCALLGRGDQYGTTIRIMNVELLSGLRNQLHFVNKHFALNSSDR
eukprot:Lankesteria_metandrocarpae@DN4073_c0_g1_i2.p1